jgi:site-specific recombinase
VTKRVVALCLAALAAASAATACPVCFGDADSQMARGANNGILFLLGVVAVVQSGFIALFVSLRRRARRLRERREQFELIEGGAR